MADPHFVYGTLKRGHVFQYALANQVFLKEVRTKPLYWMHSLGSYPGLVEADSGNGDSIFGELYCVDTPCRKLLSPRIALLGREKKALLKSPFLKVEDTQEADGSFPNRRRSKKSQKTG